MNLHVGPSITGAPSHLCPSLNSIDDLQRYDCDRLSESAVYKALSLLRCRRERPLFALPSPPTPIASGSSSLWRSSFGSYCDFLAHPLALIIISILVRLSVWYSHPLWYDILSGTIPSLVRCSLWHDILSGTTPSLACVVGEGLIALHRTLLPEYYDFFLASQCMPQ